VDNGSELPLRCTTGPAGMERRMRSALDCKCGTRTWRARGSPRPEIMERLEAAAAADPGCMDVDGPMASRWARGLWPVRSVRGGVEMPARHRP
jgi:hypothetical protein